MFKIKMYCKTNTKTINKNKYMCKNSLKNKLKKLLI